MRKTKVKAYRYDSEGRRLPDNVGQRADGRYLYRKTLRGQNILFYTDTLEEMRERIYELEQSLHTGINVNIAKMNLIDWNKQWMENYKRGKLKDATYAKMEQFFRVYIAPSPVARLPIGEIKRSNLIAMLQKVGDEKELALGTLRELTSQLYECFQQAVYDRVISYNPAQDLIKELHGKPKKEREALTGEEVKVMVNFLKKPGWQNVYLPLIAVGLSTGLRIGELAGLTWKDIDFDKREININHSMNYRDKGNKHEYFITTPKTKNAYRIMPMTDEVISLLRKQQEYQAALDIPKNVAVDGYSDFVFCTKKGTLFTHEAITRTLRLIINRANEEEAVLAEEENRKPVVIPDHTPHVWRHTFCTRLVEKGIAVENLKILMGHSSIKTTLDIYTHITQNSMKKAAQDLDNMISVLQ